MYQTTKPKERHEQEGPVRLRNNDSISSDRGSNAPREDLLMETTLSTALATALKRSRTIEQATEEYELALLEEAFGDDIADAFEEWHYTHKLY